jgi:hypothetical protein
VEFDLSAYAFQTVRIGFRFGSDGYITAAGWHLDNIEVTPRAGSLAWIELNAADGSSAPAGANPLPVKLCTDGMEPGAILTAMVRVRSNDPTSPESLVPVFLENISRAIAVTQPAHGAITPAGTVYVNAGADAAFTVQADPYYSVAAVVRGTETQTLSTARVSVTNVVWTNVTASATFGAHMAANRTVQGTPEWWLAERGLTNGSMDAQAAGDTDVDGLETWAEYVAGTDPTNAASTFAVTEVTPHCTNVLWRPVTNELGVCTVRTPIVSGLAVRWASAPNRLYSLWGAATPTSAPVELLGSILSTPPTNTVIRPLTDGPVRFYRLGVRAVESDQ